MKTVTIGEAQYHFASVLEMVEAGEEVVITRGGKKIAKLVSLGFDDPKERRVDWSAWVADQKEFLKGMPEVGENPVLAERDEYSW